MLHPACKCALLAYMETTYAQQQLAAAKKRRSDAATDDDYIDAQTAVTYWTLRTKRAQS